MLLSEIKIKIEENVLYYFITLSFFLFLAGFSYYFHIFFVLITNIHEYNLRRK